MRLHLDTTGVTAGIGGQSEAPAQSAPISSAGKATSLSPGSDISAYSGFSTGDRVAVSDASAAWAGSFSDRAGRIAQLSAAVQNGTYSVPSSALSQSIVASAFA